MNQRKEIIQHSSSMLLDFQIDISGQESHQSRDLRVHAQNYNASSFWISISSPSSEVDQHQRCVVRGQSLLTSTDILRTSLGAPPLKNMSFQNEFIKYLCSWIYLPGSVTVHYLNRIFSCYPSCHRAKGERSAGPNEVAKIIFCLYFCIILYY